MPITIRNVNPDDADALAHVLISAEQYTFRGLVPEQCLEFTEEESASNWKKSFSGDFPGEKDIFVVAETESKKVVGFAWGSPADSLPRYGSELKMVSVLPDYHRQGIGRKLIAHIAVELSKQGIESMWLKVVQVNPNRRFYDRLGGTHIKTGIYLWDDVPVIECIYAWNDTTILNKK